MVREFAFDKPDAAIEALADRLSVVKETESIGASDCVGRVLAENVVADRDSPAADVSAMDGYGIRLADLQRRDWIPVSGESRPGNAPPEMPAGAVIRIFTGAVVPDECQAVIKREDTEELDGAICFRAAARNAELGEHIRRAGENAARGSSVLASGTSLTGAQLATMANFGCDQVQVFRTVRVAIITTGDEVGRFGKQRPSAWQLRNSNQFSLAALLRPSTSVTVDHLDHCPDDRESLTKRLAERINQCDAVLMTGGVSMGDYDYVPEVVQEIGGEVIFHGLPIRPGKPILGATTPAGKLILGLPGNPVSASVGCRRFGIPLLAKMGGRANWACPQAVVRLEHAGSQTLPLHWLRLVRLTGYGIAVPVLSKGSGDLVSLGHSSGFVEVPPGAVAEAAWPYYPWD